MKDFNQDAMNSIYNKMTTNQATVFNNALTNSAYYKQNQQAQKDFSDIKGYDPTGIKTNDPNAKAGWSLFQSRMTEGQNPMVSDAAKYQLANLNLQNQNNLGNIITGSMPSVNLNNKYANLAYNDTSSDALDSYMNKYQNLIGNDLNNTANRYMSTYDLAKQMDTAQRENAFNLWKKFQEHVGNLYTADKTNS